MRPRSIAVPLLWWFSGCSSEPRQGGIDFTVQVLGAKSSFELYQVSGAGLASAKPRYFTPYYMQELSLNAPLGCEDSPSVELSAQNAGEALSSQRVSPFLCRSEPECPARTQAGWRGTETHQLFLDPDGALLKNTDFERRLTYACQWLAPDRTPVDGAGTLQSDAGACTDVLRSGTQLTLVDSATGTSLGHPDTCNGYLLGYGYGVLVAQVTFVGTGQDSIVLNLAHCVASQDEAYPLDVSAEDLRTPTCERGGASIVSTTGATERRLLPIDGSWQITSVNKSRDGSQVGIVNLTFGNDQGVPEFAVRGTISLPDIQIPGDTQ